MVNTMMILSMRLSMSLLRTNILTGEEDENN